MTEGYKRRVVCAANRCPKTWHMILGARHWDANMHTHRGIYRYAGYTEREVDFSEEGFIDQYGVFMDRQLAWKVAISAGQIIRRVGGDTANGGTLYSENLY